MGERKKINYGRLIKFTAYVIIPIVLLASLGIYAKLYGVRQALQELVRNQTDNRYSLTIGKTEIHPATLSVSFFDVALMRQENDTTSGVSSAQVPSFELRLGSISSLFSKALDISLLSVVEPEVVILAGTRHVDRSQITQHIIELYPAIEAVLARFNIGSLNVSQATLQFYEKDKNILNIRHLDLVIENWRMRDLSSTSQLKINIENQNLNLGKANLNFSGIEYNYLQHHLVFNNFSVAVADSASGSNVSISGKALKLQNLDYQALYRLQRYDLKRAEIVEPVINATFQWRKGRRSREINRNIVTRMVKQAIGECRLDSAIISRARVQVLMRQAGDTVRINLPRVDFRLNTFAVVKDSSNFQIGEMQVNLNGSAVSLPGDWTVVLDEVLLDRHRDLTLNNITIRHQRDADPVATLSTLRIGYFNLIGIIFQKRFSASTIHAEGGVVNLQRFLHTSTEETDTVIRPPDVAVDMLSLKDIQLRYRTSRTAAEVTGLSVLADKISTDQKGFVRYNLRSISADRMVINEASMGLRATLNGLLFNGRRLQAHRIEATKDSLTVAAENVETEIPSSAQKIRSLKYLSADRITLDGKLPRSSRTKPSGSFDLGQLDFRIVQARLTAGENALAFTGRNIHVDRLQWGKEFVWPRRFSGELSGVTIRTPKGHGLVNHLQVDYPRRINCQNVQLTGPKFSLAAAAITVRRPQHVRHWAADQMALHHVQLKSDARTISADSVTVATLIWQAEKPSAERVDIYKPIAAFGIPTRPSGEVSSRLIDALPARHLYLHPGSLTFEDNRHIGFGLVHIDRERQILRASYLNTSATKSDLTLRNLLIEPTRIAADSILVIPNRKWYTSLEVEETLIQAKFGQVNVRGFSLEHLTHHKAVKNLTVDIGFADFDLRRNKLLPDPPPLKKPVTLDGLIPLPPDVQVSTVNIRDGRIQYRQLSDRTGEEGYVFMDKVSAVSRFDSLSSFMTLYARANLYQSGAVELDYTTLAHDKFRLDVQVKNMDLTLLNQIIMPLQSLRIKSGYLREYKLSIHADDDNALGDAAITYDGLHLELFKHNEPERRSLGTEVLTLLADGIILKHSKENARTAVSHARVKHKSVFHYWVTSAITGATGAIRKGKRVKR